MAKKKRSQDRPAARGAGQKNDRLAQPVDAEEPPRLDFPVVALGASAGGLEAYTDFFDAMPCDSGMAFVVIQHLPPDRKSLLSELLGKRTEMPVQDVDDGMAVEANHVYVIRPDRTLTIRGGKLHLGELVERPGHRRPVDDFFRSLAEEQRERAIAVVMSGMGSNGSAGAQAIKAVGGVCIAQEPESAKFPSMPRSLIDMGLADFVLRPGDMPDVIRRYAEHPYASANQSSDVILSRERQVFSEILAVLRSRARQDFSGYKKPTVLRRIQRRMGLHQVVELSEYGRLIRQNPSEASALADDLVIHVTGFFRDPEAWMMLREQVIDPMVAEREPDSSIRAWVTACSSGEEAYSLAMLLLESAEAANKPFDIKIFATDVADRTLAQARHGLYPLGIEGELSQARLDRFFDKDDVSYRIKKEIREQVVFAPQNVLQDPPFSRLDICTCRNLLIYLEPAVQQRVLSLLHFGLKPGGALFLGTSETISGLEAMFETTDKKHRIYRRIGTVAKRAMDFPLLAAADVGSTERGHNSRVTHKLSLTHVTQKALLDRFAPAAVVVDRQMRVVYFQGETTKFLTHPSGEPTRELLEMVREGVRGAVRIAMHRAVVENEAVMVRDGFIESNQGRVRVIVRVAPLEQPPSHFLVTFEEWLEPPASESVVAPSAGSSEQKEMLAELQRIREELQSTVEELQTSNEELKASNEEVTSVNEELQSTNEELETSKEELQSLNEELTTVNAQLQTKMEELECITSDLTSLLTSTDIAVVFLDRRYQIRRFTPPVRDLFDLIPGDLGRPLSDLARKFDDPDLIGDAQAVLDRLIPVEKEVASESGRWYVRRILPYRTTDNRIDGVVMTFVDITRLRSAEKSRHAVEQQYRLLVQNVHEYAIILFDEIGKVTIWNAGAERVLGYSAAEAHGRFADFFFLPEDSEAGAAQLEFKTAREMGQADDDRWLLRKDGHRFWASGTLTALKDEQGVLRGFAKVMRDNTDRKLWEENLDAARREAEAANHAKDEFLATVSHELRTPLSAVLLWSQMLNRNLLTKGEREEALEGIERNAMQQKKLIEDLLDTSRIVSGKLRLELRAVDPVAAATSALENIQQAASTRHITIRRQFGSGIGKVSADPDRLCQVILNLLSNAVKFTPEAGVINLIVRREGRFVEFRVADSGPGVSEEVISRLFSRFFQVESPSTRVHGGLGLGLSIAKQLVDLQGGTIAVDSPNEEGGATFVVQFPVVEGGAGSEANLVAIQPENNSQPDLRGRRILLVEDDSGNRNALKTLLERAGAAVVAVSSAATALMSFQDCRPDLVISDIGLPEMDGNAFMKALRAIENGEPGLLTPAIAVSAFVQDHDRKKALDSGFLAFLAKPVNPDQLFTVVSAVLLLR